jgi:hypothetical protein
MDESVDNINLTAHVVNTEAVVIIPETPKYMELTTETTAETTSVAEITTPAVETMATSIENVTIDNKDNNTNDTSIDSGGGGGKGRLRKRTINLGLDGNYWGQLSAVVSTSKRKRKTVDRLYVGDVVSNVDDDTTKDNDDNVSETKSIQSNKKEPTMEVKKDSIQHPNRKRLYKQKAFITVRNESS